MTTPIVLTLSLLEEELSLLEAWETVAPRNLSNSEECTARHVLRESLQHHRAVGPGVKLPLPVAEALALLDLLTRTLEVETRDAPGTHRWRVCVYLTGQLRARLTYKGHLAPSAYDPANRKTL